VREQVSPLFSGGVVFDPVRELGGKAASRNPMLLLRFVGSLLLRLATRQFRGLLLIQEPPRKTRFEPFHGLT